MSEICQNIHELFWKEKRFHFPFDCDDIPLNGIYVLFQKAELGHNGDRIVRVGTHTGNNQLRSRLKQHFVNENKDRSIFRKNIGRCLLNKRNDPYLKIWELDLTPKINKNKYQNMVNKKYQSEIEKEVTKYLQDNFYFCVIRVDDKKERLSLESKIISTVSACTDCSPSKNWLGLFSPKKKIRESGLWLVNELYKKPLNENDYKRLIELLEVKKWKK